MWKNLITLLTPIMLILVALTLSWSLFPINTMEQPESHYFQMFCLWCCASWEVVPACLHAWMCLRTTRQLACHPCFPLNVSGSLQNFREEQKQRGELIFLAMVCLGHTVFENQVLPKLEKKSGKKKMKVSSLRLVSKLVAMCCKQAHSLRVYLFECKCTC